MVVLVCRDMANAGEAIAKIMQETGHLGVVATVTGTYLDGREVKECAADARDGEKSAELWQASMSLTGLQAEETVLPIGETR